MSSNNVRIWLLKLKKKRFNSRRKVNSESGQMTSSGNLFHIRGAATAKARLATVDSLTGDVTRRLLLSDQSVRWPGRSSTRTSGPRHAQIKTTKALTRGRTGHFAAVVSYLQFPIRFTSFILWLSAEKRTFSSCKLSWKRGYRGDSAKADRSRYTSGSNRKCPVTDGVKALVVDDQRRWHSWWSQTLTIVDRFRSTFLGRFSCLHVDRTKRLVRHFANVDWHPCAVPPFYDQT